MVVQVLVWGATVFQNGFISLHYHQQCIGLLSSLHYFQGLWHSFTHLFIHSFIHSSFLFIFRIVSDHDRVCHTLYSKPETSMEQNFFFIAEDYKPKSQMFCILNGDNCYTLKEAEEGGSWRSETVSCGLQLLAEGWGRMRSSKPASAAYTDISKQTNQSRL